MLWFVHVEALDVVIGFGLSGIIRNKLLFRDNFSSGAVLPSSVAAHHFSLPLILVTRPCPLFLSLPHLGDPSLSTISLAPWMQNPPDEVPRTSSKA